MKFAYWSREVAGWALVLIGLYAFWTAYVLVTNKMILQAGPVVFIGFFIFRGGIHILKVAVAAQAARSLPESAPVVRRAPKASTKFTGPTSPRAVLPGPKAGKAAPGGRG
jgi:hypothetical protein